MKVNHKAGWNKILSNKFDLKNLIDYVMCIKIINAQNTALLKNLGSAIIFIYVSHPKETIHVLKASFLCQNYARRKMRIGSVSVTPFFTSSTLNSSYIALKTQKTTDKIVKLRGTDQNKRTTHETKKSAGKTNIP
jgi:hypothetical protein